MSAPSTNSELLSAEQRHRLYRWARDMNPDVVLVCAEAQLPRFPRNHSPVLLPGCAGEDPSLAAALLACGAKRVRVLPCREAHPERCAAGAELVETPQARVLRAAEYLDATQVPVSRRALIGLGALGDGEIVVDPNAPTMIRLAQAHQVLGTQPDTSIELDAPRLIASGCQACGVCTQMCRSSALELTVVDSVASLTQNLAACTGENTCVASCPYGALSSSGQLQLADLVDGDVRELTSFPVSQCRRCGADFPAGEGEDGTAKTLCPTCERTTADPFSSWLPPGFTLD
ncbi:hypothetical protein FYJ86_07980 [Corynebacterium urealyticum]|uniref:hypothetical protein n=1 Tax=Corynebacterium urealyticum TaxID=43771 RepID=UPI0011EAF685|nr:hypothetical protein [Corynebacterium urealyticum]TYT20651.1 hypothetical protein FYJ86_07980 [Corynebacterium urealyticum]